MTFGTIRNLHKTREEETASHQMGPSMPSRDPAAPGPPGKPPPEEPCPPERLWGWLALREEWWRDVAQEEGQEGSCQEGLRRDPSREAAKHSLPSSPLSLPSWPRVAERLWQGMGHKNLPCQGLCLSCPGGSRRSSCCIHSSSKSGAKGRPLGQQSGAGLKS